MTANCAQCGKPMSAQAMFCPHCGYKTGIALDPEPVVSAVAPMTDLASAPGRGGHVSILAAVGVALAAVLLVAGLGVAAIRAGLADRQRTEREAALMHIAKGQAYLQENQVELAIAELEVGLQLLPENVEGQAALDNAYARRDAQPTATPALAQETREALFVSLQIAAQHQDWERVISQADRLLTLDPSYQREAVDDLLFDAFYRLGQQRLVAGRMEDGISLFERALALRPGNAQADEARSKASQYMIAMGYWGADWNKAIERLLALYQAHPTFLDVAERLRQAYIASADAQLTGGSACRARDLYVQALTFGAVAEVENKRVLADEQCRKASGATAAGASLAISGQYVGTLERTDDVPASQMAVRGRVLNVAGAAVAGERVRIQAFGWHAETVTDSAGEFSFEGLGNPVTYTLTLPDASAASLDVSGQWGQVAWVLFQQTK